MTALNLENLSVAELQAALEKRQRTEALQRQQKRNEYETFKDSTARRLAEAANVISGTLQEFHTDCFNSMKEMSERLNEYGDLRGNSKGGFSITSDDGNVKITYSYQAITQWDERAVKAEELLKEFMSDTVKKRDKDLYEILIGILERNTKGNLELSRIQELYKHEDKFNDSRWTEAIRLFKESYQVIGSKFYIDFYTRNENGKYIKTPLNFNQL